MKNQHWRDHRMVSLGDLVSRAVQHEQLPAPVDRDLRRGIFLGLAVIAGYLLVLLLVHISVDDHSADMPVLGWGVIRAASFLAGGAAFPALLGLAALIGGASLYFNTSGLREADRTQNVAALVIVAVGALYLIPLGLMLLVVALNLALIGLAIAVGLGFAAWIADS